MNKLNDNELEMVNGGFYRISQQKGKIAFTTMKGVSYQLINCTPDQAMEVMDALISQYSTQEEYDQACVNVLSAKGWI